MLGNSPPGLPDYSGVAAPPATSPGLVWLKHLFAVLALGFLAFFGWQARDMLSAILATASWNFLAMAVLCWMIMHLLSPLFAAIVFQGAGYRVGYADTLRIHLANLPAKYLPGGIWHTVGRIVSFRGLGISSSGIGLFVLLENLLSPAVAFLLGGGILFAGRGPDGWGSLALLCACGGAVLLVLLPLLLRIRILGYRMPVPGILHYVAAIAVIFLIWCTAASAFAAFLMAFPGLQLPGTLVQNAAAYLFSWGVGFVAVFAPQGLGVFEVTAGELLRGTQSLGGVAVLLAGFRLGILAADLLAWLAGLLLLGNATAGSRT